MTKNNLISLIESKKAHVGIIGLGYVGVPLALTFAKKGFQVTGFEINSERVAKLNSGISYIKHISPESLSEVKGHFTATTDFSLLKKMDCILICVPTPLTRYREPDLSYILESTKSVAAYLRKGQLVVLESTTYPGTTSEMMSPILENTGLKAGNDFFLAFSPEREDPNNPKYRTETIPKVIGGHTKACLEVSVALYNQVIIKTVPVSSTRVAEATKLLENIYRAVNIALVNELKMLLDRADIDVWEVIKAADTKPFGFQAFYPGPGLGGHCIPIDPFYLTWKARDFDFSTRFIELAGEINTNMPYWVVQKLTETLNTQSKSIKDSNIILVGLSYKKDIDDLRESPALKLLELILKKGGKVTYHDPYFPTFPKSEHVDADIEFTPLTKETVSTADCILVATGHSSVDYKMIAENAKLVLDTRNVVPDTGRSNVFKA